MTWPEIRNSFPDQWLLVEATEAHSAENHRILDQMAVVDTFPSGRQAMDRYLRLHEEIPARELYVLHTENEALEIEELRWL